MYESVFISSTCHDLVDLRAEIEADLRELGINPVMSDRHTSDFTVIPDNNSIETCLANLKKSNAAIFVISQRYGPSLLTAGFEDLSATHLEYRTAVENNIPIFFYVRDRLEGEMNAYLGSKTKDPSILKWVKKTDIRIFEFLEEHKKLSNNNKNNWYWVFKDSVELKQRIRKDFHTSIGKQVLRKLIQDGKVPLLDISISSGFVGVKTILLSIIVKNIGNSVAIGPSLTYKEAYKDDAQESNFFHFNTLLPLEKSEIINIPLEVGMDKDYRELDFEISYSTIYGVNLGDIFEVSIHYNVVAQTVIEAFASLRTKKNYGTEAFTIDA